MAPFLKFFLRIMAIVLGWLPFIAFFSIIALMFIKDFKNPVDEYFVSLILKASLMLIVATLLSQALVLTVLLSWSQLGTPKPQTLLKGIHYLDNFPIVDIGIYSIGIFLSAPRVMDWIWVLMSFLIISTLSYWLIFLKGPIRNLFVFARFHQVKKHKINQVMAPFYIKSFIDYFFVVLKLHLMPLVFILVVMDFRIIMPRLVDSGLSYQAFVLFLSLIISLQMLSYKTEIV